MTRLPVWLGVLGLGMLLTGGAFAGQIFATSYTMPNGFYDSIGSPSVVYDFEDTSYTPCNLGAGNCAPANYSTAIGATLSGGLGKLTDGVTSTLSYDQQTTVVGGVNTPTYVAWYPNSTYHGVNPTVSFSFGALSDTVVQVGIHVDNEYESGNGTLVPASVTIDGTNFQVITGANLSTYESTPGPVWLYFTVSDAISSGVPLTVQFNQEILTSCCSVAVDEVTFSDSGQGQQSVGPEPGTWSLFAGGLVALVALARKRKR